MGGPRAAGGLCADTDCQPRQLCPRHLQLRKQGQISPQRGSQHRLQQRQMLPLHRSDQRWFGRQCHRLHHGGHGDQRAYHVRDERRDRRGCTALGRRTGTGFEVPRDLPNHPEYRLTADLLYDPQGQHRTHQAVCLCFGHQLLDRRHRRIGQCSHARL